MSRQAPNKEAMPIANAGHCCNSGIFHAASPRCFPYTTACQLTQPVVGYTARDTALEFGPPSGTGKLIPLLLDAGTSRCTRFPPPSSYIWHKWQLLFHQVQEVPVSSSSGISFPVPLGGPSSNAVSRTT